MPEPVGVEIGAHDDRELGLDVVRIADGADDAERLLATVGARAHRDEGHLA